MGQCIRWMLIGQAFGKSRKKKQHALVDMLPSPMSVAIIIRYIITRLENHLVSAGVPQEAAKSIIKLFSNLTQGVSRGIPVGPHATHLLAECVFDPIDRNLLDEDYVFCRFVDDIHIFCKTRQQAQIAFYDLAELLDKEQKLSLQSHKSRILSAEEFIEYADHIIAEAPLSPLERDIVEVIDRYTSGDRYRNIDFAVLSEEGFNDPEPA